MNFIEFVAVIRRHKSLVRVGLAAALMVAVLSSYKLDGLGLVSRSQSRYETTAVVAIKPGAEIQPAATPAEVAPTTTVAPVGSVPVPVDTTGATTTGASSLDAVIDSRGLYYSALSIQTALVAPGFAERVHATLPTMDGSISAVVPLDTNTIRLVVDGSTPIRAMATMRVALEQLQPLVNSYATSGAFRFTLDAEVISGPSTPTSVSSIKGPLTVTVVFGVAIVVLWLGLRAYDILQLQNRGPDHASRARQRRIDSSGLEPDVDEEIAEVSSHPESDAAEEDVGDQKPDWEKTTAAASDDPDTLVGEQDVGDPEPDAEETTADASDDPDALVGEEVPASSESDASVWAEVPAASESDSAVGEPVVKRVPARSGRKPRRLTTRDFEDETPSTWPR